MVFSLLNITRDTVLGWFGLASFSQLFIFEVVDMIIMALAIGYIFSGYLKKPIQRDYDPVTHFKKQSQWENIKFAALVAGPAVVLHELAHKFVAMGFGAKAVLYAPYGIYAVVALLKAIGFPFLFLIGGFVVHTPLPPFQSAMVSLAGPLTNLLIWALITFWLGKKLAPKYQAFAFPLAKISLFLAIFNILPIPSFDGYHFFRGLWQAFT